MPIDEEFGKRLLALETALLAIAGLDRRSGLFEAQRLAKAALSGEALEAAQIGHSLSDPKYYARARRALELNWGNACVYCGVSGLLLTLEIEHATPVSRGGSDGPQNLLLACHECNQKKGTQTLEEFWFGHLFLKLVGQTLGGA